MDMSLSKLWEMVKGREVWCPAVHGVTKRQRVGHDLVTKQQQNDLMIKRRSWVVKQ